MAMLAHLYNDGRAAERHALDADATLRGEDQLPIGIAGVDRRRPRIVRALGQRYGCEFTVALTEAEAAAARTASGGTIVDFPVWPHPSIKEDLPGVAKLSRRVRLAVLAGTTAAVWAAVLPAVRLLH